VGGNPAVGPATRNGATPVTATGPLAAGAAADTSIDIRALGPGVWVELSVVADIEAVEAVSEILTRFAPGGTSIEPGFGLTDEGLGAVIDPTRPATVRAYLPGLDPAGVEAAIAEATTALGHLQAFGLRPIGELQAVLVHEADWAEAWKSHFPVLRVGRRMVIRPTWRRHRRLPGDVVLSLDPGMAFGTGLHPTTRLCLAALETLADEGLLARGLARGGNARVIDVGCGSGILAIAAGKLGAGEILGVDTDPIAVESTLANARLNRLTRRLRVHRGSVPSGEGPFDIVLANLIASLLVQVAGPLRDELAAGGRILASGIFRDREGDVAASFTAAGLRPGRRWAEEDWVALEAIAVQGRAAPISPRVDPRGVASSGRPRCTGRPLREEWTRRHLTSLLRGGALARSEEESPSGSRW
jgi:ribosomal protein L11 methyltransferase